MNARIDVSVPGRNREIIKIYVPNQAWVAWLTGFQNMLDGTDAGFQVSDEKSCTVDFRVAKSKREVRSRCTKGRGSARIEMPMQTAEFAGKGTATILVQDPPERFARHGAANALPQARAAAPRLRFSHLGGLAARPARRRPAAPMRRLPSYPLPADSRALRPGAASMHFDLTEGTAILQRTPAALRALLSGLSPAWVDATEGPETWSPRVVLGHLVHTERNDWIRRARIVVDQGEDRRFPPVDRLAQFREIGDSSVDELLAEFERLRAASLATLAAWRLTDAQLALQAEHPAFGNVQLRQLLSTWVAHDLAHLAQIARVMARQYREAVGPWRAYLSIMDR